MKLKVALLLGAMIVTVAIISAPHILQKTQDTTPPPEEPSLQKPPQVESTKEAKPETTPTTTPIEHKEPGVICTDDCPLINPEYVEREVREYFSDIPIMIAITECESTFRQFDKDGRPLKNKSGSSATGALQIMASVHQESAMEMGYDIRTLEGNLAYGRYLHDKNGTRDWKATQNCWESKTVAVLSRISN